MSLMPDDDPRQGIELPRRKEKAAPPYGITAILIGLAVVLLGRVFTHGAWPWTLALLVGAVVAGSLAYLALTTLRPTLNLILLCALAAVLGHLFSTPAHQIYIAAWSQVMILGIVTSGIFGAFAGWALGVDQAPELIVTFSFLAMFVVVGMIYFVSNLIPVAPR